MYGEIRLDINSSIPEGYIKSRIKRKFQWFIRNAID